MCIRDRAKSTNTGTPVKSWNSTRAGETVLVTGGGGSIGSELCRQLCKVAPARIVIFDMYENDAYMLRNELLAEYDDIDLVIEIGNVRCV